MKDRGAPRERVQRIGAAWGSIARAAVIAGSAAGIGVVLAWSAGLLAVRLPDMLLITGVAVVAVAWVTAAIRFNSSRKGSSLRLAFAAEHSGMKDAIDQLVATIRRRGAGSERDARIEMQKVAERIDACRADARMRGLWGLELEAWIELEMEESGVQLAELDEEMLAPILDLLERIHGEATESSALHPGH